MVRDSPSLSPPDFCFVFKSVQMLPKLPSCRYCLTFFLIVLLSFWFFKVKTVKCLDANEILSFMKFSQVIPTTCISHHISYFFEYIFLCQ